MSPEEKSRQNVYVFLVCLLFSIIIWLLIVLSKEYKTALSVKIEYDMVPNNLLLVNKPEDELILNLETSGWNILKYKYLRKNPSVSIDLSSIKLKKENGLYVTSLLTSQFQPEIADQLDLPNMFNDLMPTSIQLEFEAVASKKVKVIPDLNLGFKKQFSLYDSARIIPDSVIIYGSAENLSAITGIATLPITFQDLDKEKTTVAKVVVPGDKGVKRISPEEVEVIIPVSEYTEETLSLPVVVKGGEGMKFKTFPEDASLVFHVPVKQYTRVNKNLFEVSALFDLIDSSKDNRLPLRVTSKPPFTRIVSLSPDSVEFIIIKNNQ